MVRGPKMPIAPITITIDTLIKPFKSGMRNAYREMSVNTLYYLFRGDVDAVEASFRRARRIGALRAQRGAPPRRV